MMELSDVRELSREINAYTAHFAGLPLLVGVDSTQDYRALLDLLAVDPGKQVQRMSDFCLSEFPPKPYFYLSHVNQAAQTQPVIWLGAAQAIMLYGQQETSAFFTDLAGTAVRGPLVLLCPYCCGVLESIGRSYVKLGMSIITMRSGARDIPSICIHGDAASCPDEKPLIGMKALLRALEDGAPVSPLHVITSCEKRHLSASAFPFVESLSAYEALCKRELGLAAGTIEANGTDAQWQQLAKQITAAGSFAALCEQELCPLKQLAADFPDHMTGSEDEQFFCFIALKTFCGTNRDYLAACLKNCQSAKELLPAIYHTILDVAPDDPRFPAFLRQRRRILQAFDENNALMKDFCDRATIYGSQILRYLSDDTEEEQAALIHALCTYRYPPDELTALLRDAAPELCLYLQQFSFNAFNTRVMEADAPVRDLLTDYFQRYKLQKLTNHVDAEFVAVVEEAAAKRPFTKLQMRSAIVKRMEKQNVLPFFFDALGAEFLAYIEAKAEQYGMQFECQIGCCNLPSITSRNKDFYDAFPADSIRKVSAIDELKHHGTKYDYRVTTEPLHLFDELAVLDHELKKMSTLLAAEKAEKIVILSDHGASRLAVTYQSENDRLVLDEAGQHSGRCCPAAQDPHIPFASYEDGFAVLANYERFKGSRKADVEAHGGATLEEVIVPVITLTAKPRELQVSFPEAIVKCSPKDGSSIMLYANPPLHAPRMVVGEAAYDGVFEGDKHNVRFTMPDLRRKGKYSADIYDGSTKVASLSFETKRSTGTNELF